jgi:hypothetical protein
MTVLQMGPEGKEPTPEAALIGGKRHGEIVAG